MEEEEEEKEEEEKEERRLSGGQVQGSPQSAIQESHRNREDWESGGAGRRRAQGARQAGAEAGGPLSGRSAARVRGNQHESGPRPALRGVVLALGRRRRLPWAPGARLARSLRPPPPPPPARSRRMEAARRSRRAARAAAAAAAGAGAAAAEAAGSGPEPPRLAPPPPLKPLLPLLPPPEPLLLLLPPPPHTHRERVNSPAAGEK